MLCLPAPSRFTQGSPQGRQYRIILPAEVQLANSFTSYEYGGSQFRIRTLQIRHAQMIGLGDPEHYGRLLIFLLFFAYA
jgi:hypothetical protein